MVFQKYPYQRSWRWIFVKLIDFILIPFGPLFRRKPFPDYVRNILVIRLDQIGDLVCALPIFPLLKKKFPYARITVLADNFARDILEGNPYVDRLFTFSRNWFSQGKKFSWFHFYQIISEIKKVHFDLGFDLRGDIRNIFLMILGKVRYRVGYGIAGGGSLLNQQVPYDSSLHQVELNAKLVEGKVVPKNELIPEVNLSHYEKANAREELVMAGVKESDHLIAIHPEAGCSSKEWGVDQFKELIHSILAKTDAKILIFGVSSAQRLADEFRDSDRVINFVGKISLKKMVAILSHCSLFIGHDSGPSHLAQAVGVPKIIFASGTNQYEIWGVWVKTCHVFKQDVSCAPCQLRQCNVSGHPCMSGIRVEDVMRTVLDLMKLETRSMKL
ncbi:MAG: hypothetical protein A3G33_06595 [Omnitrophica bacterium RIFCSPLOWO2_12_FULL_44_17]|uniref:Lipopolysaccharide heptosyltransferase II n=1 Tax=Candidatus Danuiimicrobium aquiferis TaxID=1801832 RepID=A0A1G1KRQ4_9BACT|nr:MAG: hypothetical protein A3E74_04015 [Omnitrophica bacterium RIFCSPHIGHO2_12_FULL_44_12]OGW95492.1 MAG: hypothetical protein A3G33_06595 [Omnitrophica bacterium RIFCSPLOWO2_12_FULL_44_17]OGX01855.1 MAG: hypothetical protein A3J12_09930 [Omnitrophica bacterium RIFCSPLOWO2_02_FULL_44_11]